MNIVARCFEAIHIPSASSGRKKRLTVTTTVSTEHGQYIILTTIMPEYSKRNYMFPEILTTDRLHHDRLCHETVDVLPLYRICSHDPGLEEITRYMPWSPHKTPKDSKDYLDRSERE